MTERSKPTGEQAQETKEWLDKRKGIFVQKSITKGIAKSKGDLGKIANQFSEEPPDEQARME